MNFPIFNRLPQGTVQGPENYGGYSVSGINTLTASYFVGNGENITGVAVLDKANTFTNALNTFAGVTATTVSAVSFVGSGENLTGVAVLDHANVFTNALNTFSGITASTVSATSFVGNGSLLTGVTLGATTFTLSGTSAGWYRVATLQGSGPVQFNIQIGVPGGISLLTLLVNATNGVLTASVLGNSYLYTQYLTQFRLCYNSSTGLGYLDLYTTGGATLLQIGQNSNATLQFTASPSTTGLTTQVYSLPSTGAYFSGNVTVGGEYIGSGLGLTGVALLASNNTLTGANTITGITTFNNTVNIEGGNYFLFGSSGSASAIQIDASTGLQFGFPDGSGNDSQSILQFSNGQNALQIGDLNAFNTGVQIITNGQIAYDFYFGQFFLDINTYTKVFSWNSNGIEAYNQLILGTPNGGSCTLACNNISGTQTNNLPSVGGVLAAQDAGHTSGVAVWNSSGQIQQATLSGLTISGTTLTATGGSPNYIQHETLFTASGTFTVPTNVTSVKVTVTGAAGGTPTTGAYNSGGAAGGTAIKVITGLTAGQTIAVTVGTCASSTSTGGSSSFGTICTATGGSPGAAGSGQQGNTSGGTASGGDINLTGGCGNAALTGNIWSGGTSYWGGPSSGTYGAGAVAGGAGNSGCVLVEWVSQ